MLLGFQNIIFSKKTAYLFVALFSLVISLVLYRFFTAGSSHKVYLKEVEKNLKAEVALADEMVFRYKRVLKEVTAINFTAFNKLTYPYPLFVFKNTKLVYWSDHRHNIPYSELQGNYIEKCLSLNSPERFFFVKRSTLIVNNEDFEIFVLIPLQTKFDVTNRYLQSGLNRHIFSTRQVSLGLGESAGFPIYYSRNFGSSEQKTYLFSVHFPSDFSFSANKSWIVLFFAAVSLFTAFLFVNTEVKRQFKKQHIFWAFLLLCLNIWGVRYALLSLQTSPFFTKPLSFLPAEPDASLIHLVINLFTLLLGLLLFLRFFRYWFPYRRLLKTPAICHPLFSIFPIILTYFAAYQIYRVLWILYQNPSLSLDIGRSIEFSFFRFTGLLVLISANVIYFLFVHIVSKLMMRFGQTAYNITVNFLIGSILYYAISFYFRTNDIVIFNINALYISVITLLAMPQSLQRKSYKSLLYPLVCAFMGALISTYAIYDFEQKRNKTEKTRHAHELLLKHDRIGEQQLSQAIHKIKNDRFIQKTLLIGMPLRKTTIAKRIRRLYLGHYLEKYDTEISLFNGAGAPFLRAKENFQQIQKRYDNQTFQTAYPNIFYANQLKREHYLCFVQIKNESQNNVGHIILNLKPKRLIPNSINQSFWIDSKYARATPSANHSYAIYNHAELVYSFGDFAYDNNFLQPFLHKKNFVVPELQLKAHHHLCIRQDNQVVIVSSPTYPKRYLFANFSFLFMLLASVILLGYFVHQITRTNYYRLNFATKVQLYLNLSFFIPLFIVSLVTISILNNTNEKETQFYFLEKARSISESDNLISAVSDFIDGLSSRDQLLFEIANISDFTQSDINLYDSRGKLLTTSQPYLFSHNLLSSYINAKAFAGIYEQKQRKILLTESIGALTYNTAYVGIQSYKTGTLIGVVSVPFYTASSRFQTQIIEVFVTVIQVFTLIFLILLALSYLSAKSLIHPIRLITQKIKHTTLNEHNELLDYQAEDEFGLLANAYNKMIGKLEASRQALAHSQKEAAWREMAKQVAHEIKNPLTPMKLILQQLQRRLKNEKGIEKPISTLLEQVDILSDIATSFASFAKMPIPISQEFEISHVLKKTLNLHDIDRDIEIIANIPDGEFYIIGDSQLMHRIFTNLLLNGIQSVPLHRKAILKVNLMPLHPKRILIEIKDNGAGIPLSIRNKVFVPNFTTKSGGSGIGLAVAKHGIEHSGGGIWFETEIEVGTTFFIEFPRC